MLAEAEQFTTGRFNDTPLFSGDNPHCRNAVTISQETPARVFIIFTALIKAKNVLSVLKDVDSKLPRFLDNEVMLEQFKAVAFSSQDAIGCIFST